MPLAMHVAKNGNVSGVKERRPKVHVLEAAGTGHWTSSRRVEKWSKTNWGSVCGNHFTFAFLEANVCWQSKFPEPWHNNTGLAGDRGHPGPWPRQATLSEQLAVTTHTRFCPPSGDVHIGRQHRPAWPLAHTARQSELEYCSGEKCNWCITCALRRPLGRGLANYEVNLHDHNFWIDKLHKII